MKPKYQVLIIDDDKEMHKALKFALEDEFDFTSIFSLDEVDRTLYQQKFDLILLDLKFGKKETELAGLNIIPLISQKSFTPIVVITANKQWKVAVESMKRGAFHALTKAKYDLLEWKSIFYEAINERKIKVFLSHSTKDKEFVDYLGEKFQEENFSVWINNIEAGEELESAISQGIEASNYVVVVLSPDSVKSEWVKAEWNKALKLEKKGKIRRVIPILLRDCNIPLRLDKKLHIDFRNPDLIAENTKRLIDSILTGKAPKPKLKEKPKGPINPEYTALSKIKSLIAKSDLKAALLLLLKGTITSKNLEGENFAIVNLAKLHKLEEERLKELISEDKIDVKFSTLCFNLLSFINQEPIKNELESYF